MKPESSQVLSDLLRRLTEAAGVPGCEDEVRAVMREELAGVGAMHADNLGSLIVEKAGAAAPPRIMVAAHMDEIGFMVNGITDKGFLRFSPLGGWWAHVMLAQRVHVGTRRGRIPGLIGARPVHQVPRDKRDRLVKIEDMFIDAGATSRKDAEQRLGVRIGDPVTPDAPFTPLAGGRRIAAKALDDRLGCAVMIETLRRLKGRKHPNTVFGVGTVQEEVGARGARTAAHLVNPDLCLVLDVGLAGDTPDASRDGIESRLGSGPQVCVLDGGMIGNLKLRDFVLDTAEKMKIPCQLFAISSGATDGSHIHLHGIGVPSLYLGVPTRYIHSHLGVADLDDIERAIRLVVGVIKRLDAAVLARCR